MNLKTTLLASCVALLSFTTYAQTLNFTGNSIAEVFQDDGSTTVNAGNLALYVEANNVFSNITSFINDGISLTLGSTFGTGGDTFTIFAKQAVTSTGFSFLPNNFVPSGFGVEVGSDVVGNKEFGVLFFQTSTSGAVSLTTSEYYGAVRDSSWVTPTTGGTYDFSGAPFTQVASATADQQVQAVPEPSAFAGMFGLMALLLAGRRRA